MSGGGGLAIIGSKKLKKTLGVTEFKIEMERVDLKSQA